MDSHGGRVLELDYRDDGQDGDERAGDHRVTNRFVPSLDALAQAAPVRIVALIAARGIERSVMLDFDYAPRRVLEVRSISDAPEDGRTPRRLPRRGGPRSGRALLRGEPARGGR